MTGIKIEVEGDPIPLQRPRGTRKGFYDPQHIAKKNFAWTVKAELIKQEYKEKPVTSGVKTVFNFEFQIPQSWSKKKKAALINKPHTQKPDTSNLVKFVEDSLNEILWQDDCYISKIEASKRWAEKPKTIIKMDIDTNDDI